MLKNEGNPTNTFLYFFHICNILRNINAEGEDKRKFDVKFELLTKSGSQIALYLVKYTRYQ